MTGDRNTAADSLTQTAGPLGRQANPASPPISSSVAPGRHHGRTGMELTSQATHPSAQEASSSGLPDLKPVLRLMMTGGE